ncbi:MAG: peptidylprolyl isomerase [Dysgonomonas sp.]
MNKKLFLICCSLLITLCLFAQQTDPAVFTLNGKPVYKSEIERAYKKGNENLQTKVSIDDFLTSYIEFKMNVEEAKVEKLDTTASYIRQFESYRMQIAAPYLKDTVYENEYVKKMYGRLLENVEVNHLIIPFNKDLIFPADTLPVYKKAIEARNKILKDGFSDEILKIGETSPNKLFGIEGQSGYLGWIAAFMLSPRLEDAIYTLSHREVSMPIRTVNGYHIVQVLNRRPAVGSAEIEQVMFRFSHIPASQHQIDSVRKVALEEYENIHTPADFQTLCNAFSKAYKTGDKGCYFGLVGLDSNLSPEFLSAVFNLQNKGDVSKPLKTEYGFHIVRLLNKIPVPEFGKMENQIRYKIGNGSRRYEFGKERKQSLINSMNINVNDDAFAKLNDIALNISPRDSAFLSYIKNSDEQLVDIDGKRSVPVKEFVRYIDYRQRALEKNPDELEMLTAVDASPYSLSTDILKEYFDSFLTILAMDYKDDMLEEESPDFRAIMDEFSNGLLLYEVKNKNIWERAKSDESGLEDYFTKNKSKYKLDQPHYKGIIIYAKDAQTLRRTEILAKKNRNIENLIGEIRNSINKDSVLVRIEPGLWTKGDNQYVDYKVYGESEPSSSDDEFPFFSVVGKTIKQPEEYKDVKAEVELDYQTKLEKDWNSYLYSRYNVDINKSVLNTIK